MEEQYITTSTKTFTSFAELLKNKKVEDIKPQQNNRKEIIRKFVDRLNREREISGYKKLPASVYAIKMYDSGLKTDYLLSWFYGYCTDARNFSACWWGSLKYKKQLSTEDKEK